MNTLNYSSLRSNLASVLDKVNDDHSPVIVTRQNGKAAVIISLEDFKSYEETAYLMASPKNAKRLNDAIAEIEAGKILRHDLITSKSSL
jgi:antitoxin YefM